MRINLMKFLYFSQSTFLSALFEDMDIWILKKADSNKKN